MGLPDGTAWAVGYAQRPTPGSFEHVTLAMHFDGTQWTHTPTPYVAAWDGGANDFLHAVEALAPDDVWAAGERHGDAGGLSVGAWLHVLHWDGSSGSEVPVPEPPGGAGINFSGTRVYDIAAFAPDDIWFGGAWAHPNALSSVTRRPLAMHWDGSDMTVYDTPVLSIGSEQMHMRQMAAVAPDDIWGICRANTATGLSNPPAVIHWDGSAWSQVSVPSLGSAVVLDDITAAGPDDVWVFGHVYFPSTPFALHWDGSGWTQHGAPFATTAAALGPDELYLGTSTITLFDGASSQVVETFPDVDGPSVLGMDAAGDCTLWAVGRMWGPPGEDLRPFAARMDPTSAGASWTDVGGGLPGSHGTPTLFGDGELMPASEVRLDLGSAMELSSSTLVVGLSTANASVYGGTLVPFPDLLLPGLPTGPAGAWTLLDTWPAGVPSGLSVWFQAWVQDPAGPFGWSATRALRADVP